MVSVLSERTHASHTHTHTHTNTHALLFICIIQSNRRMLHVLENEHSRGTIFYMFRHFMTAIISDSLYRLKLCSYN